MRMSVVYTFGVRWSLLLCHRTESALSIVIFANILKVCVFFFSFSHDDTLSSASFRAQQPPSRDRIRLVTSDAVAGEEAY